MTVLGVDIGGTKIAVGLIDAATGKLLLSQKTPTLAQEGGTAVLGRALDLATQVIAEAQGKGIESPMAVGIGAGGQIDYRTGVVLSATDILPGWAGTRLAESFSTKFAVPAFADNDVNAFALGEHRFGAAQGARDVVFLALGTGVGGAALIDGKLHRGRHGVGGELGHLVFQPTRTGVMTLEEMTCGPALVRHYKELLRTEVGWIAADPEPTDGYAVAAAATDNPRSAAARAVEYLGECLGYGLVSLTHILDPERFVIGGGLIHLGDRILGPARSVLAASALPLFKDTVVVPAALGADSSIVGAACVALSQL